MKKAPTGGRRPKDHVRHDFKIQKRLSDRLTAYAKSTGATATAVVEQLIADHLPPVVGEIFKA